MLGRLRHHIGQTLLFVTVTATVVMVTAGVGITCLEGEHNGNIHGIGDGLWWAITTMTTVGYGDKFPVSAGGRVLGGFLMIIGISVLSSVWPHSSKASQASWLCSTQRRQAIPWTEHRQVRGTVNQSGLPS